MAHASPYRTEITACTASPGYYRWTIFQDGQPLDLPGYAYASAWSASEAAGVALKWHLILQPLRAQPSMDGCPALDTVAAAPRRDAA